MAQFLPVVSRPLLGISLAAALMGALIPGSASAARLNDGYIGCISKDALSEFTQALIKKDERAQKYLLGTSCVPTSSKFPITVLDRGIMRTQYRVYVGKDALELWSPSEAISN